MSKLAVSEIFGPTFQGEGPSIGMPCFFLRLAGCNLSCVWCDTPYTWDWTGRNGQAYDKAKEVHMYTVDEVYVRLATMALDNSFLRKLVITGGEPLLQTPILVELVEMLKSDEWWVEVETAGTVAPGNKLAVDRYNVSLKLENSGNKLTVRRRPKSIEWFVKNKKAIFKFVVAEQADFDEIAVLQNLYSIDKDRIYIMPEGKSADAVNTHSQDIAAQTIARGYRLTTRLHVLLYGNRRGI